MSSLVIVESPAKAKTISRFLGKDYIVEASYGHIRDLPQKAGEIPSKVKKESWARLGVNIENDFEPLYVVSSDKKKHVKRLKEALAQVDEILLATDEDREGESISWHVVEVLNPKVPIRRIAFHEITEEAIKNALASPREIDERLVRAQESRRIMDRLFGYQLSPLLWKKIKTGLSAGRVQSVAVRLCVLRERKRRAFMSADYWKVQAHFTHLGQEFTANLSRLDDQKVSVGSNFDPDTGVLKKASKSRWIREEAEAESLIAGWDSPWSVTSTDKKPLKRRPAPPFTTSSLQQEANRKLGFAARHTMRVAQGLYEGVDLGGERIGLITYMRTDSFTLSKRALAQAQELIRSQYGDEYTPGPRGYRTQAKGAQEAHEAIRPTDLFRSPEKVKAFLGRDEFRLYEMIWKRTLASQMSDAQLERTTVEITAKGSSPTGLFTATGTTVVFPGFFRVYVEGSDDPNGSLSNREVLLPKVEEGLNLTPEAVESQCSSTQPPARYTEATLVKRLEAEGIGRPSTYASTIDTIQRREYIEKQGKALVPTFTAVAVTQLLEKHFANYVDLHFTARMEDELDQIAEGKTQSLVYLREFWHGDEENPGLAATLEKEEPNIEYPAIELASDPESGEPIFVRVGRWGPYLQLQRGDEKISASIPADLAPADLSAEKILELINASKDGPRELGEDESGTTVYLDRGRFGPYVQLGETVKGGPKPKRASLLKGMEESEVNLELALRLLSLPRTLGVNEKEEEVIATRGRFGPYIKAGSESRSLKGDDDPYTINLARALELLAQPKPGRGRSRTKTVLNSLGADSEGDKLEIIEGPYGPYLTNGKLNASLPKGQDPKAFTLEEGIQLLQEKGKAPRGRRRKTTKKKTTRKKTKASKPTKKKT